MKTSLMIFLLFNTISSIGLCSFKDFLDTKNLNGKWQKASSEYSKISYLSDAKRLDRTKQLLMNICSNRSSKCLTAYSHYFSYLFFKTVLKRKYTKTYLSKIDELTQLQMKMTQKCKGEPICTEQTITALCGISDTTSMFVKPFCISNYFVSTALWIKSEVTHE